MPEPITLKDRGDRALRLADHAMLVATLDENGFPQPLTGAAASGGDWETPVSHDAKEFTYVNDGTADDDKVETIVYKKDGATVATLTFAYVGSTNNIASITKS